MNWLQNSYVVTGTCRTNLIIVKRKQIARALARQKRLAEPAARDQVDKLVHKMLKKLRKGQPVQIPGIGRLTPE